MAQPPVAFPHRLVRGLVGLVAFFTGVFGPNAYVGAENLANYDQRMLGTLALLDADPTTNQLHAVLDSNRVVVRFVAMAPGVYARYSVARHVIEIDDRWADTDDITLAAVIAHEATHEQDAVSGYLGSGGASACIDSEVRAFRTSALFWLDQYGTAGKPGSLNDVERPLNLMPQSQVR